MRRPIRIIALILFAVSIISLTACGGENSPKAFDRAYPTTDKLLEIKDGMHIDEVTELVGNHLGTFGSGMVRYVYCSEDGVIAFCQFVSDYNNAEDRKADNVTFKYPEADSGLELDAFAPLDSDKAKLPEESDVSKLKVGMTYEDVLKILGAPQRRDTGDELVFEYDLKNGEILRLRWINHSVVSEYADLPECLYLIKINA